MLLLSCLVLFSPNCRLTLRLLSDIHLPSISLEHIRTYVHTFFQPQNHCGTLQYIQLLVKSAEGTKNDVCIAKEEKISTENGRNKIMPEVRTG